MDNSDLSGIGNYYSVETQKTQSREAESNQTYSNDSNKTDEHPSS